MPSLPTRVLLALALALLSVPHGRAGGVTPLAKVIEMLGTMLTKAKESKNSEETEFAAYSKWCDGTKKGYSKSIADTASQIEQLTADIDKANADAEELGTAAAEHLSNSDAMEAEAANATSIREKEHADYLASHADFSESVDAIGRAISVLKSRSADVKQSLLEIRDVLTRKQLPVDLPSSLQSLLALKDGQAPQANAYEFQSGGVVEMLEKLKAKFIDERVALEKAELNAKANHEVLLQRLTGSIKQAKGTAAEKTEAKGQRLEAASIAKGDKSRGQTGKAEDEKALDETTAECSARAAEYEKNQALRADEIKAIEQAKSILEGEAVTGAAATYLPAASMLQRRAVALAQFRGSAAEISSPGLRARESALLQQRADQLGSRYLSLVATHLAADPFVKVKALIKDLLVKLQEEDLLVKLQEEANAEADQNAFCTTELATNKQTREEKQSDVDKLSAKAEKLTADGERLSSELTELSDAVAELNGRRAEATSNRADEKKTNAQTVADAREAQVAVEKAIAILKEFYGKAAEASSSLLQRSKHGGREPYGGMQTENGNILGFLDVVLSDFARLEAETSGAEDQAQGAHEKFMAESSQDLAVKQTTIAHKEKAKQDGATSLASVNKELELTHEELTAALSYAEKLKADCVDTGLSYEDRKAKREEEIKSLQEALRVLDGEDLSA